MGAQSENVMLVVLWAIGSLFLALLLLFGLFGGILLGALMIPLFLLVAPIVALVVSTKRESQVAPDGTGFAEEAIEVPADTGAVEAPRLEAAVVDSSGVCPMNREFLVGERWTLNGTWSGKELCPLAKKLLNESAARLRSGEASEGELCQCLGKDHRIVFQLQTVREDERMASAAHA